MLAKKEVIRQLQVGILPVLNSIMRHPMGFFNFASILSCFRKLEMSVPRPRNLWSFYDVILANGYYYWVPCTEMRATHYVEDGQQIYSNSKFQPKRKWSRQFMASLRATESNQIDWIQLPRRPADIIRRNLVASTLHRARGVIRQG